MCGILQYILFFSPNVGYPKSLNKKMIRTPCGVIAKVLDYGQKLRGFKPYLHYYVFLRINTLGNA